MSTLTKVLIGAAAVTTVAVVISVKNKKAEKKDSQYTCMKEDEQEEKKESVIKRIKSYVTKRIIRFLGWVAIHMEQIEAAATVIGLVGTVVSITGAVRDFAKGNDLNKKLDEVSEKLDYLTEISKGEFKSLYEDHNILAKNQAAIAKHMGVATK